jgi:16S rRNA (guanine527-N7)-methyltransferase
VVPASVEEVLGRSRDLGFLGPGDLTPHIEHAAAFSEAAAAALPRPPKRCVDLGSGGGLPGLVLAALWPETQLVLADGATRRCAFLEEAVVEIGVESHVTVVCGRAEDLARDPALRASFDLVVARSFGAPPVLAECAAGFLEPGGHLLVSEPPEGSEARWPQEGLRKLGMGPARVIEVGARFVLIEQIASCSDRYPRRVGVPAKRPLF